MRRHFVPSVSRRSLVAWALLAGIFLGLSSRLVTQTEPSANDRGGPVVVGGLPCLVDPSLADMFWLPLGGSQPGPVLGMPPVLGVVGPPDLDGVLVRAQGTPYGWIETNPGYRVLGLSNQGIVTLDRAACVAGTAVLWQWVPDVYLGGTVTIHTALGNRSNAVTTSAFQLPLAEVAVQSGNSTGTVEIRPNPDNQGLGVLWVQITATGHTVQVQYQP